MAEQGAEGAVIGLCDDQLELPIGEFVTGFIDDQPESFRPGFRVWMTENMHVWKRFEAEALKLWHRGRKHYSARTIIEVLRHESALSDSGQDFKLNNNAAPDLARLFLARHPGIPLFELRNGGRP